MGKYIFAGGVRFAVNWRCGCVVSEKAIEEVKSDVCHSCGGPVNKDDLVMLNPPEHILQIYEAKLEEERAKKAAKTRSKKHEFGNHKS
ncbi:unnamed protein product [Gongylonema pulchrum]|uniref:Rtf2 domain-containing protein n=1 Tax=Gongylonema pulchrum TaxID=637853 RepID=A0A183ETU5_9BILA|nr:unnamed protein product [Gongylonema pulchrum]